jgi:uncharacterized HAD superfamily protein
MKKQSSKQKKVLKIGLDLDGVILYNPARIVRPIIAGIKKLFFKERKDKFLVPQTKFQQIIWEIFHLSSIFIAPGFDEIKQMAKEKKIELYLITARYSFLEKGVEDFIKKINGDQIFKKWYYNKYDEQPHLYKDKFMKKLKLDIFVEDNYDIANYLTKKNENLQVYWITNIIDSKIEFKNKFNTLQDAMKKIKRQVEKLK